MQIENGYRSPKEKKPGAVQRGHFREIEPGNPDAEPVAPCAAARPAIIVFGRRAGTTLTVCTDNQCPIHDPRAAAKREAPTPAPTMPPTVEAETEAQEQLERRQDFEEKQKVYEAEQERRAEERRLEIEREEQEYEAEQTRKEKMRKARINTFERILANAAATFSAAQLRVLLRAFVHLDPYTFADDLAEEIAGDNENENEQRAAEEVLLSTIDSAPDADLPRFALRLALTGHVGIPREGEIDFLAEADAAFTAAQPKPKPVKKSKKPTPIQPPTRKPAAKNKKKAAA